MSGKCETIAEGKGSQRKQRSGGGCAVMAVFGCLFGLLASGAAGAAPVELDTGFGQHGIAFPIVPSGAPVTPLGSLPGSGSEPLIGDMRAIAMQPDGKFVVVGTQTVSPCFEACSGTDQDFVTIDEDSISHQATQNRNWVVVSRFNADGTPDITFQETGSTTISFDEVNNPVAVAVQPDGKIVIAGSAQPFLPFGGPVDENLTRWAVVARLTAGGDIDRGFGNDGMARVSLGVPAASANIAGMVLQTGGRILLVGSLEGHEPLAQPGLIDDPAACDQCSVDFLLLRFTSDGRLDSSFAQKTTQLPSGGRISVPNPTGSTTTELDGQAAATAVALQADGRIVVAGCWARSGTQALAVVRYSANGAIDPSFGGAGVVLTILDTYPDLGFGRDCYQDNARLTFVQGKVGMAIQADGKVVVAARKLDPVACQTETASHCSNPVVAIARYNPDGSLDHAFGSGGIATTSLPRRDGFPIDPQPTSLLVQPDGKIVVAGSTGFPGLGFVFRYTPNGQLDVNFGSVGEVALPLRSSDGNFVQPNAMAIQKKSLTQGEILLVGRGDDLAGNEPGLAAVARVDAFTTSLLPPHR